MESRKCAGVPPDPANSSKMIAKNDGGTFVCLECNAEIKHRNNIKSCQKLCKN